MKRPAIFFDRDNTLIVSAGYLGDPDGVVLMDGAAAAVTRARELGFATVVVSNQSGVARGMFDEAAVEAVNRRMDELLLSADRRAVIDRHEFCPFHPEATVEEYRHDSDLRKPRPGMIYKAAESMALDLPTSWVVGDAPRDIEAGKAAGCRAILLYDAKLTASPAATERKRVEPDFVVGTLAEAIDVIEREMTTRATPAIPPPLTIPPTQSDGRPIRPDAPPNAVTPDPAGPPPAVPRVEALLEQLLHDSRRRAEQSSAEFSVSKLMAGIVQVIVLAVLFFAYLSRNDHQATLVTLMVAMTLQAMTIALLLMGTQR